MQPAVAAPAGQTVDCRVVWLLSPDHVIRRWRSDLSSGETVNPAGGAEGGGEICWSEVNTSKGGGGAGGGARVTSLLLVTSCLDFLHLPLLGGESPCSSPGGGGVRTWAPPDDEAWRENRRRTAAMCFLLSCEEIRSDPSAEEGSTSGWAGRGTGGGGGLLKVDCRGWSGCV